MSHSVLIVDDSKHTVDTVRGVLEEDFDDVAVAGDGETAVAKYEEHDPDLVVMDILLPGPDGREATAEIKERDPDATVLVLTSYDSQQDRRQAFEADADHYMEKPFDGDELKASLARLAGE